MLRSFGYPGVSFEDIQPMLLKELQAGLLLGLPPTLQSLKDNPIIVSIKPFKVLIRDLDRFHSD
jgi:hypothetical protein